jgi:LysM repeat protein
MFVHVLQACTESYTVQAEDECQKIADANQISLQQLMHLNPTINQACTNLQPGQQLCLQQASSSSDPACTGGSYVVAANDTCSSIAAASSISAADLISANPSINEACTNLQIGQTICIPASSTKPACSTQYTVQPDDTCESIAAAAEIPLQQLTTLNPSVNEPCTNLQIGQQLCIVVSGNDPTTAVPSPAPAAPASPRPPAQALPPPPSETTPPPPPLPLNATCQGLVVTTTAPASNPSSLAAMLQVEMMQLLGMNPQLEAGQQVPAGTQVNDTGVPESNSLSTVAVLAL